MVYVDDTQKTPSNSENTFWEWLQNIPPQKLYCDTEEVKVLRSDLTFCVSETDRLVLRKKDSSAPDRDIGTLSALVIALGYLATSRQNLNELLCKMLKTTPKKAEDWIERSYSTYRFSLVQFKQASHLTKVDSTKALENVKLILKLKTHPSAFTRTKRLSAPLTLNWTATHNCNRFCTYCYISTIKTGKKLSAKTCPNKVLSIERIMNIFDEGKEIGISRIRILGGEPFLAKNFVKLYQYIKNIGISVTINTKSKAPEVILESFDFSDLLWISLDSCYKKTVCELTGSASAYDDMMCNIERARGKEFLGIVSVVNRYNIAEILDTIKMASDFGVKRIRLTCCMRSIHSNNNSLLISTNEAKKLYEKIKDTYPEMRAGATIIITDLCPSPLWDPASHSKPIIYSEAGISPLDRLLDCSLNAVYLALFRARKTLRRLLRSSLQTVNDW